MNNTLGLLLLCFSVLGDSSADDPPEQVNAFIGLPVILPCRQKIPQNADIPTIEWSKPGLKPSPYVFVYQNYEMYGDKHKDFEFRTHLFMTEVHHGNFSMRLSEVRETDAGIYLCKTIWDKDKHDIKRLELVVGHIPTPKLSVVSFESGVVNLSCEVYACFSNLVHLTFWDGHGSTLEADKDKITNKDESGCYSLEQRVTAPISAKSIVCRAEFAVIGQSRDTHMLIPEGVKETCALPMVCVGIGAASFALILGGVCFVRNKFSKKSKKGMVRQSTDESTISYKSENQQPLLRRTSLTVVEVEMPVELPTLTAEPMECISSTPNSNVSKAESRNGSVFGFFTDSPDHDTADAKPAPGEISAASNSVNSVNNEGEKRVKLIRQDASDGESTLANLSSATWQLTKGKGKSPTKKCPAVRTRSASDSYTPFNDRTHNWRRLSVSALSVRFEQLQEDPEQETFPSATGRQE